MITRLYCKQIFDDGTEFTQTLTKVNGVIERVPSDELNRNWQTEYTTDIRMSFGYVEGNVLTVEEREKILEFLKGKSSSVYYNDNTWTIDGVIHTYSYVYSVKNPINNDRRKIVFEKVDDYYILIIGGLYYIKEPSLELLIERNIDIF